MKRFKKLLCVLLAAAMLFSVTALAATNDDNGKYVTVTVTTDKQSYAAMNIAKVTVQAENTGNQDLRDVVLTLTADNYLLARGSASNVLTVGVLKKGETKSLTVSCAVNRRASGINLFSRFRLFFRDLFQRPTAFAAYSDASKSSALSAVTVQHGGATFTLTGTAWYAPVKEQQETPVVQTNDIDSYSDALSDLIAENTNEDFNEEEALSDAFYAARIIVKADKLHLDGYHPSKIIEGPDDTFIVQFADKDEAQRFCQSQKNESGTDFAEPDAYEKYIEACNSWGVTYIEADQKAQYLVNNDYNRVITVAVVDTGVDNTHPFLAGRVLTTGYDYVDGDRNAYEGTEGTGHGTHVSGTIVDCTPGLNILILPVRVLSSGGSGYNSWVAAGIKYAAKRSNVINMSLGGGKSSVIDDAVDYAISQGVTCCVAAGNENSDTAYCSPANVSTPGSICVSAIDSSGQKASFSNYGAAVDVCAPGVDVKSCVPGGGYATWSGTSMATPHVAACAAMIKLENNSATPAQVESLLKAKVQDLGEKGWDRFYGDGVPKLMNGNSTGGETVTFGSYPQTDVTAAMGTALNAAPQTWRSYGYYTGTGSWYDGQMTAKDYMQYCDVTYGGAKYRGVRFSQYRPYYTGYTSSARHTVQDENGYSPNTTYWFRYDPLRWRVLDPNTGLVLCETIIDSQPYNNFILSSGTDEYGSTAYWGDAGMTHYANNYAESSLRKWLNDDFYNTAFTSAEKSKIRTAALDNSAYSTAFSAYDSASTNDKVFLLSYSDVRNTSYGFSSSDGNDDAARRAKGTDYAKCQGLGELTYDGNKCSLWWLRSAGGYSYYACYVHYDAHIYHYDVSGTDVGIRPALKLNLES